MSTIHSIMRLIQVLICLRGRIRWSSLPGTIRVTSSRRAVVSLCTRLKTHLFGKQFAEGSGELRHGAFSERRVCKVMAETVRDASTDKNVCVTFVQAILKLANQNA